MIIHVVLRNRLDINKVNNIFLKDEKQPEVVKIICVILTLKHDIKVSRSSFSKYLTILKVNSIKKYF